MTYLKQSLGRIPCTLEMLVKKSLSLTHSNHSIIAVWISGLGRTDSQTSQMETAQRTLGWCPTVKENKLFSFLLFLSRPNLVSSQKLSQKFLGLFPGARSGGWFRETGSQQGNQRLSSARWPCPDGAAAGLPTGVGLSCARQAPSPLPLASFFALCACYLLVTTWLLQF